MRDQPCCHLDSDVKVIGIVLCKGVTRGRFVPTDVCFFSRTPLNISEIGMQLLGVSMLFGRQWY